MHKRGGRNFFAFLGETDLDWRFQGLSMWGSLYIYNQQAAKVSPLFLSLTFLSLLIYGNQYTWSIFLLTFMGDE